MKIVEIKNMDNEVYHNSDKYKQFWSSSNIKNYSKTPKEAYYQKFYTGNSQSASMRDGTLIHDFLYSKHINGDKFPYNLFMPPINERTGNYYGTSSDKYKTALKHVLNPITGKELKMVNDVWDMIKFSEYSLLFKDLLQNSIPECSFFVELDSGLKYKYRPDILADNCIYDYKKIAKKDFNYVGMKRAIANYGYDISASFYQKFEFLRTGTWKPFKIFWITAEPAFDILLMDITSYGYELINGTLRINPAAQMLENLLKQHENCMSASNWPGMANRYENIEGYRTAIAEPSNYYNSDYEHFKID